MAARAYRHQHLAEAPRGWRVRSKRTGEHVVRVAFPPGARRRGAGKLVEILHPKKNPACENGECSIAQNPAEELLIFGNPSSAFEDGRKAGHSDGYAGAQMLRQHSVVSATPGYSRDYALGYRKGFKEGRRERKRHGLNPSRRANRGEYVQAMADRLEADYRAKLKDGMGHEEAMSAAIVKGNAPAKAIAEFKRRIGNPRRARNKLSKLYDIWEITPSDETRRMYQGLARAEAKKTLGELRKRTEGSGWRYIMKRPQENSSPRARVSSGGIGNHKPGCKCAFCKRIRARGSNPGTGKARQERRRRAPLARRRRNQSEGGELRQAVSLFGTFHGRDPEEIIEKQRSAAMRLEYTTLGDLEYLIVQPDPDGKAVQINFEGDRVKLASAPNGRQLYLIGGNQSLDRLLEKFTDDPQKDFIDLGEALEVQYDARKIHSNFQPTSWYHAFGKEKQPGDGALPRLMYDKLKKEIFFVGGEYFIDTNVAISPGIEN